MYWKSFYSHFPTIISSFMLALWLWNMTFNFYISDDYETWLSHVHLHFYEHQLTRAAIVETVVTCVVWCLSVVSKYVMTNVWCLCEYITSICDVQIWTVKLLSVSLQPQQQQLLHGLYLCSTSVSEQSERYYHHYYYCCLCCWPGQENWWKQPPFISN